MTDDDRRHTSVGDLLFVGGAVWTGTGQRADAVAVADGLVVALGADALERRRATTQIVELGGCTLLPGFRDGHLHPLEGGTESLDADLVDAADVDEVLARVATYAAANPDLPWIVGYGYPPEILPDGLARADLIDRVLADRPVALWSSDHHMAWCNTRALQVAGITGATADPPRGTIVRDADGAPIGMLLEEADKLLRPHLPPRGTDKEVRGLRVGLARMAGAGLVWGLDAWSQPERLHAYHRVAEAGELTADLDLAFKAEVDGWREQLPGFQDARSDAAAAAARRRDDAVPGGRLSATTVKFFVDGVIEAGTGHLLDPYHPLGGGADSNRARVGQQRDHGHDHGIANWDPAELIEAAVAADAAGFQLHLHAIGDAAVRTALDTFEAVATRNGPRDRRPTVAHTHLVHPDDLPRFRQLGVVANFEPLWAQSNEIMTELTEPRLGPERSRWQYPIGSLVRDGAHVSFGSDWPVSSHEPLHGIPVAVTRQDATGDPPEGWLPGERITLDQALTAYTAGTAYQAGDEAVAGTVAVGKRADLVVVGADLRSVPAPELRDLEVLGTWLGGQPVHATGNLPSA